MTRSYMRRSSSVAMPRLPSVDTGPPSDLRSTFAALAPRHRFMLPSGMHTLIPTFVSAYPAARRGRCSASKLRTVHSKARRAARHDRCSGLSRPRFYLQRSARSPPQPTPGVPKAIASAGGLRRPPRAAAGGGVVSIAAMAHG
eukprot:354935-Chlamydomonas_euryale.AAC.6